MEFDDLQKIWTTQNETHLYTLNETAMQNYIASKVKKTLHRTNLSELVLIAVYLGTGIFILLTVGRYFYIRLTGVWILMVSLAILVGKVLRSAGQKRFDKSMLGDLRHAASVAAYQVKLSLAMRWNSVVIGISVLFALWNSHKPLWTMGLIGFFFVSSILAGRWEYRRNKTQKRELEILIHDLSLQ